MTNLLCTNPINQNMNIVHPPTRMLSHHNHQPQIDAWPNSDHSEVQSSKIVTIQQYKGIHTGLPHNMAGERLKAP